MESSKSNNFQNSRRIAKNTMMLYLRLILVMIVSLYTSRVILKTLGIENYGIYTLVSGIVSMFGFLNTAMATATQRFFSFEIGKNDNLKLNKTFNASQNIHLLIALFVLIVAETVGIWFINQYLNIEMSRMFAAKWIFHFSVITLAIKIIQVPYNALIIAREKMNIYAIVSIIEVVLLLFIVYLINQFKYDVLITYGFLLLSVSIIIASIYRLYVVKNFYESKFILVKDRELYKSLLSYSGWNLFGSISVLAKNQGVSIILNLFFGTVVNAAQGIANQVYAAVYSFVSNFQVASNPQIIKYYASDKEEQMFDLVVRTSKFSFYLLLILMLPIILEIDYILEIWLSNVPNYTSTFTVLVLINALLDCISGPLMTSLQATGKIKVYQITIGILVILILPISYLLFKFGNPPYVTFTVGIFISLIALLARLFLVKKQILNFPIKTFLREVIIKGLLIAMFSLIIPFSLVNNMPLGLDRLIVVTLSSMVSSFIVIYFIGLDKKEKTYIKKWISNTTVKLLK